MIVVWLLHKPVDVSLEVDIDMVPLRLLPHHPADTLELLFGIWDEEHLVGANGASTLVEFKSKRVRVPSLIRPIDLIGDLQVVKIPNSRHGHIGHTLLEETIDVNDSGVHGLSLALMNRKSVACLNGHVVRGHSVVLLILGIRKGYDLTIFSDDLN